MRAIILAAGRGSRLGAGSDDLPKCLLEVGRRRLIEHQLETLSEAGVGPVPMVPGYCADEVRVGVGLPREQEPEGDDLAVQREVRLERERHHRDRPVGEPARRQRRVGGEVVPAGAGRGDPGEAT